MEKGKNCGTRLAQFLHGISTLHRHFKHIVEHISFFQCLTNVYLVYKYNLANNKIDRLTFTLPEKLLTFMQNSNYFS